MPDRRILYLTQHQLQAYVHLDGRFVADGDFAAEAASSLFVAYLKEHENSVFTLVVNIAEEGFQQETIPYVQSRDRKTILDRKLGQAFFGAPLTVAVSLGHEKTSRRNERLLLAALTSSTLLEPWLQAFRSSETRIAGIHSLPLLTESLVSRLKLPKERGIFVTIQDGTIRQSFLDKGRLLFSRVSPLSNSSVSGLTANVISELARLQQYLQSQRLVARGETIVAHVVLHPQVRAALDPDMAPAGVRIHAIDLHDAARLVGLKEIPEDSRSQNLFLQIAARIPPSTQFAPFALRKPYVLWRTGKAIQAVGAITFLTCGMYAAKLHLDQMRVLDRVQELASSAEVKDRQYQSVLATFPPIPLANDTLRQVIDRFDSILKTDRTPERMTQHLSRALELNPQVELISVDWQGPAPRLQSGTSQQAQAAQTREAGEAMTVRGTVSMGRNSTPRQLVDILDQFFEQLRRDPTITVSIIKQPFDTTSAKALKSGEGDTAASDKAREFEVRLQQVAPS